MWRRGERPNILNIVAWRNYLTPFDRQQLATLIVTQNVCVMQCNVLCFQHPQWQHRIFSPFLISRRSFEEVQHI